MPSHSPKQKRTMAAAAHDADFAAKVGIPQSVARDFFRADQRQARRHSIAKALHKSKTRTK